MAERYRSNRSAGKRQPLTELSNRANTPPVQRRTQKSGKTTTSSPGSLPHNESLEPNGSLAVRSSQPSSPEHKRVSQIANENERDSKRLSAISTASTTASGRKRKTYIGHWQLGKTIGKGGCSRVRAVRHKYTRQYGAVKIIARSTAESTRAQSLANLIESSKSSASFAGAGQRPIPYGLEREIAVMKLLEHENIVRLYDVWENRNELYLIMEYVDGGELFHYVEQRRGLAEDEAIIIFRQIVSALLYCHRLHICHRDLKPENILLNLQSLQVKLIDFGMAALQPEGRLLSTPCGSPHYAAPEVVSSRPYDGKQADVWSCGVILYVMLTGMTPYNYGQEGDIRVLFRDISKARYYMPPDLSMEAKDLIKRIFMPDPRRRITMDDIFDHPLVHKYDEQFGFVGAEGSKEAAIGPIPRLEDWTVKRIQDIDRETLRNMRTLWHSEPEQSLIRKLLNNEINQEKIFYAAIMKHKEEHLENYVGDPDGMGYSASDYHHSQPTNAANAPPMPLDRQQRSQSQYSIKDNEHLRPSHSFIEPPPSSISSYDPYRASKDPIVNGRNDYVNVIVHRNGSSGTRKASVGRSLRHPNSLRVEMLKHGSKRISNHSNSSLTRSGRSRMSMQRSSMSRHSMTSSLWPSSPPVIATMRPSDLHKRGVSFGHVRRSSTASALNSQAGSAWETIPPTPRLPDNISERASMRPPSSVLAPGVSPTAQGSQVVRSRKEKVSIPQTPQIKVRRPVETPGYLMRSDIRKHSAELEKACEEAFFRSSVGSSMTSKTITSMTDKPSPYDTPPSSVSRRGSDSEKQLQKATGRPLPELPKDTPNTYLERTLEETREKLAAYKTGGEENTTKFDEVMKMLDNLMPGSRNPERRLVSAPEAKTPDHLNGFLPVISEESDQRSSRDGLGNWRSVTAPVQKQKPKEDRTIRVVPPSSPGMIAPLSVRKRSNGSEASDDTIRRLNVRPSYERMNSKRSNDRAPAPALESIDEDAPLPSPQPAVVRKKKSAWFGLSRKAAEHELLPIRPDTPTAFGDLDDRTTKRQGRLLRKQHVPDKSLPDEPPPSAQSSEFPLRKTRFNGGKKGFSKWLGRFGADGKGSAGGEYSHFNGDDLLS